jgi:multiple sugar transport system substrate-binding protein
MIALGCVSAAILAACGKSDGGSTKLGKAEAVDTNIPVTFNFFGNSAQDQDYFNRYYGDALKKKFPKYTFNYIQKVTGVDFASLIAAGTPIDFYYATIGNLESALLQYGMEVDMTDLIKMYGLDTTKFEPSQLNAMRLNTGGKVYGVPIQGNIQIMYYNKGIFDRFGVAYPKDNMTWDDAAELTKKLTRSDGGKQFFGFGQSTSHILRSNQLSLARFDAKTNLPIITTETKWKLFYETIYQKMMPGEAYKKAFTDSPSKLGSINTFMKDQDTAMFAFFAQMHLTNPNELKTFDWDVVTLPTFKEAPGIGSQQYPMMFGITKQTKNVPAAMEVLKYMSGEEYQVGLARKGWMSSLTLPAVQKEYGQDTEFKDKNWKSLFALKPAPIPYTPDFDPSLVNAYVAIVPDVVKQTSDLNTLFRGVDEKSKKIMEEAQRAK